MIKQITKFSFFVFFASFTIVPATIASESLKSVNTLLSSPSQVTGSDLRKPILISQDLRQLPVVSSAEPKLNDLQSRFGWSRQDLLYRVTIFGNWYIDTANSNNINIFLSRPDYVLIPGYIRVTLDPTRSRVISAGLNRYRDVQSGILTGRYISTNRR